jgi:hypothetical protein
MSLILSAVLAMTDLLKDRGRRGVPRRHRQFAAHRDVQNIARSFDDRKLR